MPWNIRLPVAALAEALVAGGEEAARDAARGQAPVQVAIVPIGEEQYEYATQVAEQLRTAEIRVEIRAEAETQVARLDYAAGVDRLRAAQDLIRGGKLGANGGVDHIEASIIDTRKREVELRLKEQTLDKEIT